MGNFFRIKLSTYYNVTALITVHYFKYARDFEEFSETHDFYELVYADSGKAEIVNGGERFFLHQGEGFIHRPNVFHGIKACGDYANIIVVTFDCKDGLSEICDRVFALCSTQKRLLEEIVRESESCFEEPLDIVDLKKMTVRENCPLGALHIIKNTLEKLLILISRDIARQSATEHKKDSSPPEALHRRLTQYLEAHITENITLGQLSKHFGYSVAYLKKLFSQAKGCGIIHYHLMLKTEHAKKLIADGDKGFSDIAHMLGFSSPQYFCRVFKGFTNMTPSQYKNSVKRLRLL